MPIPKPNKGENQADFISRCMSDSVMKADYPQNQRLAVCFSSWKTAKTAKSAEIDSSTENVSKITIPAAVTRSAEFERQSVDIENKTATLSVSSDQPYQRFFGTEILSHKDGAVRLNR